MNIVCITNRRVLVLHLESTVGWLWIPFFVCGPLIAAFTYAVGWMLAEKRAQSLCSLNPAVMLKGCRATVFVASEITKIPLGFIAMALAWQGLQKQKKRGYSIYVATCLLGWACGTTACRLIFVVSLATGIIR